MSYSGIWYFAEGHFAGGLETNQRPLSRGGVWTWIPCETHFVTSDWTKHDVWAKLVCFPKGVYGVCTVQVCVFPGRAALAGRALTITRPTDWGICAYLVFQVIRNRPNTNEVQDLQWFDHRGKRAALFLLPADVSTSHEATKEHIY